MNNILSDNFDPFRKVIRETIALFDELIAFENKKLDAIAANDVALLDQHMKDEQAYLLKMRGLDLKREKIQETMGLSGEPFKEIIEKFEGEHKEDLSALYETLSEKSNELKSAIASTKKFIELHISSISMLLERLEGNTGYDKNGEKAADKTPPAKFKPTKA